MGFQVNESGERPFFHSDVVRHFQHKGGDVGFLIHLYKPSGKMGFDKRCDGCGPNRACLRLKRSREDRNRRERHPVFRPLWRRRHRRFFWRCPGNLWHARFVMVIMDQANFFRGHRRQALKKRLCAGAISRNEEIKKIFSPFIKAQPLGLAIVSFPSRATTKRISNDDVSSKSTCESKQGVGSSHPFSSRKNYPKTAYRRA